MIIKKIIKSVYNLINLKKKHQHSSFFPLTFYFFLPLSFTVEVVLLFSITIMSALDVDVVSVTGTGVVVPFDDGFIVTHFGAVGVTFDVDAGF